MDLTGQKFNKLTLIKRVNINSRNYYECLCDCGGTKTASGWRIKSGLVKSCGCARKDADKTRNIGKRLEKGLSCARRVIGYYKRNAENRNIQFDLSEEECLTLFKQNCLYCNRPPFNVISYKSYHGSLVYTGIDRKDNTKGYITNNSVPCCKDCNYMKRELTFEEFKGIITLIYNNLKDNI